MNKTELYTIILTHYNQVKYIEEALNSIFFQTYKNIQLIVIDDCSKEFEKSKIEKFIEKNRKNNITDYKVIKNDKNLGTVKSLNYALNFSKGEYIQFFAADDALYNENVVENFVNSFHKNQENIITSQCLMYDQQLKKIYAKGIDSEKVSLLNEKTANDQYKSVAFSCLYGAGATAYRKKIFEKHGKFCEKYKLVEDWSYFLHVTKNNEKILYENFISLKHREGGTSHSLHGKKTTPLHVKYYYMDILKIFENEILNNLNNFNKLEKIEIIDSYRNHVQYYLKSLPELREEKNKIIHNLYKRNPHYLFIRAIKKILRMFFYNKKIINSIIIYYLLCLITLYMNIFNLNVMLLLFVVLLYKTKIWQTIKQLTEKIIKKLDMKNIKLLKKIKFITVALIWYFLSLKIVEIEYYKINSISIIFLGLLYPIVRLIIMKIFQIIDNIIKNEKQKYKKNINENAYSVIITNYNQENYIYEAIDSVLKQDYNYIEIIIIDDASKEFNNKKIISYINHQKRKNLKNYKILINKKNIGTVKTIKKALKYVNGKYISFLAADDVFYDTNVIKNFVNTFKNKKHNIIASKALMMDQKMIETKEEMPIKDCDFINKYNSVRQYELLLEGPLFASASISFNKKILLKSKFSNKYKLIEDWPLLLTLTKNGEKIYYSKFYSLKHRGGGVSEKSFDNLLIKKQINKDILKIYKKEIFPNYVYMDTNIKKKIIEKYSFYVKERNYCKIKNMYLKILIKLKLILK